MNTTFNEVKDIFLSKITDYDICKLNEEELDIELKLKLKSAMAKYSPSDVKFDDTLNEFDRELSNIEIEILAIGLVSSWITPMINTLSLIKQSMNSKDFNMTSQANHLKQLQLLRQEINQEASHWSTKNGIIQGNKKRKKVGYNL